MVKFEQKKDTIPTVQRYLKPLSCANFHEFLGEGRCFAHDLASISVHSRWIYPGQEQITSRKAAK